MSGALAAGEPPAARPTMNGLRVSDVGKLLALLGQQGTVTQLANPRLLTLNNEPSIVRSATMSFSVTPQIAGDAVVTLSVTPIVSSPAVFESDMLARVADGETLVVSGFTRDREVKEKAGRRRQWRLVRPEDGDHAQACRARDSADGKSRRRRVGSLTCTNTTTVFRRSRSA
jgi:Type II secretory pathway, component PulD